MSYLAWRLPLESILTKTTVVDLGRVETFSVAVFAFLKLLRTERSVSGRELADAVGVHPQTIGYIESRQYNLRLALAFRLAKYFGLTLDAVFLPRAFPPLDNEALKSEPSAMNICAAVATARYPAAEPPWRFSRSP